jgi:hypothetical protein
MPPLRRAEPPHVERKPPGTHDRPAATPQPEPRRDPQADAAELTAKIAETQKRTAEHPASYASEAERDRHAHAAWAACAAGIAAETVAGRNDLSPEKRNSGPIWAEALNAFANDLMTSDPPPHLRPGEPTGLVQSGVP